jgi:hypothetical protein
MTPLIAIQVMGLVFKLKTRNVVEVVQTVEAETIYEFEGE